MSMLARLADGVWVESLAWALVHFFWQGALVALVAYVLARRPGVTATGRYAIGVLALAAMLAAPIATFLVIAGGRPASAANRAPVAREMPDEFELPATGVAPMRAPAPAEAARAAIQPHTFVLLVWMAGVVALSLRLAGGWIVARRLLRRAVRPASTDVQSLARSIAGRLALDRIVRVVESSAVTVPVMIGWLKPVVLMPASAVSGLSPTQIEALLAHELAHVRRNDYLVNLLQSAVETLLFYHPAVWWVSRQVRADREHCCDDLAVGVCDRLVYVTALADLAALAKAPGVALAATDGPLLTRVRRLLGRTGADRPLAPTWRPAAVVLAAGVLVPGALAAARAEVRVGEGVHAFEQGVAAQRPAERGSGEYRWSSGRDTVAVKWTGAFRLTDDDKDIAWIEPGRLVRVSDGALLLATGVDVTANAEGALERKYYRNGFAQPFEPEGRVFLEQALQALVRRSGFAAESRVARFLATGGTDAVLSEIDRLESSHARRRYYTELFEQATLSPADVTRVIKRAQQAIDSDYELASLVVAAAPKAGANDEALVVLLEATSAIGSDYEARRAITAVMPERPSASVGGAALAASRGLNSDFERATLLLSFIRKGGMSAATQPAFFDLVKGMRSSHEQSRVLRAAVVAPGSSEDVRLEAARVAQGMSSDHERRQVLSAAMADEPVTARSAAGVIESAAAIKSSHERSTVLLDLVKKGGVTNETQAAFFTAVSGLPSGYEQRRVLQAVLAEPTLTDPVFAGVLRAAASVRGDFERSELLLAAARRKPVTGEARALYLAAADGIKSEHDQTRVLAALVRSERSGR